LWAQARAPAACVGYHEAPNRRPLHIDVLNDTATAPGAVTRRFVAWTVRHGKWLWAVALLLAIPASWRTATLYRHLRSEIEELLPRSAPSVVAVDELRHRMAGLQ
jgi:hypothetical protein